MKTNFFGNELKAIKKVNRYRKRVLFDENMVDLASNDYLGLSLDKKILKKAYKSVKNNKFNSSRASMLVNGYSKIHQKLEKTLSTANNFDDCIICGSGFLANISLIESICKKGDILFIDEYYHASGMLMLKSSDAKVVVFAHNDTDDLKQKIAQNPTRKNKKSIIAIEGVYSMHGDIAKKEFNDIAKSNNSLLIVDEAHSCGTIGDDLLGWFDFHHIKIEPNHIKMGTFSKAYASYGAYILASSFTIEYLINRAKPIIYSTSLGLFDTALAYEAFVHIQKNKTNIIKKMKKKQKIVKKVFKLNNCDTLIVPIVINDDKKTLEIQKALKKENYLVGAIRKPTVDKSIIRIIIKQDVSNQLLKKFCDKLKSIIEF